MFTTMADGPVANLPRIMPLAKDYPAGHVIREHVHGTGQLVHAASGTMRVTTASGCWLASPSRAVWVPAGVAHSIEMTAAVSLRTLYVAESSHPHLPKACGAIEASPVLAALVHDIAADAPTTMIGRKLRGALVLEELSIAPSVPCFLPLGRDPRLRRAILRLLERPADPITLDQLAAEAGASPRTLARLFKRETGLTIRYWREQQRVIEAMDHLRDGESVGEVAAKLGYASASAFGTMIKRATGHPPAALIRGVDRGQPSRALEKVRSTTQ